MATYLGFLRAINLGANRKFPKAAIVAATEAAGFTDVATHINTGNVRFDTTMRSRARIEEALETAYLADRGFEVLTIVFSPAEVCAIVDAVEELAAGYQGPHYVSLLKRSPDAAEIKQIEALGSDGERVHVRGRAVHLLLAEQYRQARVTNATVEKLLGPATNRNLKVIRAVAEKWC
jgi:uncharacterized protein (DUF1697 family)